MTIAIVTAQGQGTPVAERPAFAQQRKAKARPNERRRMISHRGAAGRAAFESDPQSRACDLDVTDYRLGRPDLCLAGEVRGRRRLHADPRLDVDL